MNPVYIIILFFLLITPLSADWSSKEYLYATGGVHSNDEAIWQDGENLKVFGSSSGQYQQGSSASQYVTGPGLSELSSTSSLGTEYKSASEIKYNGGGAVWDTLSVNSMVPNESELACTASEMVLTGTDVVTGSIPDHVWASGMTGAQGPNGDYISDKLVDTEVYALSSQFQGRGMYHADFVTENEVGFDKNSATLQHTEEARKHKFGASNLSGGIVAQTDYTVNLITFSDPFGLTPSNQTASNLTDYINITAVDESVNQTEEEA